MVGAQTGTDDDMYARCRMGESVSKAVLVRGALP